MLKVSHHLDLSASAFVVFSIPAAVFWPYFAGAVTLVIGLGTSIKNRIGKLPDSTNSSFLVRSCLRLPWRSSAPTTSSRPASLRRLYRRGFRGTYSGPSSQGQSSSAG